MIRRNLIICIIGVCIVIGFVNQTPSTSEDERTPLYELRAAKNLENFGLTPPGSVNNDLEFGSIATTDLKVQTRTQNQTSSLQTKQTAGITCGIVTCFLTCIGGSFYCRIEPATVPPAIPCPFTVCPDPDEIDTEPQEPEPWKTYDKRCRIATRSIQCG